MSTIKIFYSQVYELNKREYWLITILNIAGGFVLNYFNPDILIQFAVPFLMFLKTIAFVRAANVMPSISSDFDRFSWKYFQGLPLSKTEIVRALTLTHLFVVSSLVIWLLAFFPQITNFFTDEMARYNFERATLVGAFTVPLIICTSFLSLRNQILFPRRQYSKNDARIVFYNLVKSLAVGLASLFYLTLGYFYIEELLDVKFSPFISSAIKFSFKYFFSWWGLLPVWAIAYSLYSGTLKIWQDENFGYIKINWAHKRDFSITAVCILSVFLPTYYFSTSTPVYYDDGSILEAVYNKDYKKVKSLIASGKNINKANEYGLTPLHVAAIEGNSRMFDLLEDLGANRNLKIIGQKDYKYKGYDVLSLAITLNHPTLVSHLIFSNFPLNQTIPDWNGPLHLAASYCRTEILDQLIKKGAKLSAINTKGSTALHMAARNQCFGAVTSLVEAGLSPLIKDHQGKMARDLLSRDYRDKDMAYYLEKKGRMPAGK